MEFSHKRCAADVSEEMLAMPVEQLAALSRYPLHILPTTKDLYSWLARLMADDIKARNSLGERTRWILPVGPKAHYPLLAQITNQEKISWKNVYAFHMDEWLDWQGRLVPADHPLSFKGYMMRHLYELIDPALRPPEDQIIYPSPGEIDSFSERLRKVGGADIAFAGFGYRGHLAFNEPPSTRWRKVTADELAASLTRIVPLLDDTTIALSQRMTGGCTQAIPPMAITIGMADILAARTVHLVTDGGSWKRYILRIFLLTTDRDPDLPVTLLHGHKDVRVTVDANSAAPICTGLEP